MAKKLSKTPSKAKAAARRARRPVAKKATPAKLRAVRAAARRASVRAAASPASFALARAMGLLNWTHRMTQTQLKDWPADKWCAQFAGHANHALWTVGHLCTAYAWWTGLLGGKPHPLPEAYAKHFGYRSQPHGDASAYPAPAEVLENLEASFRAVSAAAAALSPADAEAPTAADSSGMAKDRLEALLLLSWHEGWHQGQLSLLRKALGLPGTM